MLYGIKDAAKLIVCTSADVPVLYADYAKTSLIEFTAESVYAHSGSTKAIRWDAQREGKFKTEMEIFEKKWIALLFGKSITSGTKSVVEREVLSVAAGGGGAVLAKTPKAGTLSIFITDAEGIEQGIEQTVGNAGTTVNKYSIANNVELTFNATTFASPGKVIAVYMVDGTHKNFTVDNVTFPGGYKIYANSAIRGTDQVDVYIQYQLHNVKPMSNVSFGMDADNPVTLSIEWDILANANGDMMTYIEK